MLCDSSVCLYHQRTDPVSLLSFSPRIPCFAGRCKHGRCFRGVWVTGSTGEVAVSLPGARQGARPRRGECAGGPALTGTPGEPDRRETEQAFWSSETGTSVSCHRKAKNGAHGDDDTGIYAPPSTKLLRKPSINSNL